MQDTELTDWDTIREQPSEFVTSIMGIEPFDYQQEFLDADTRHRVIVSGRQVGKSRMAAWIALHRAMTEPHSLILITAPSLRQSSLLFDTLLSEIRQSGLSDDQWGIDRDTQTIIEFDNGTAIHSVPTGRDGTNIRGYTADVIIVDEAAFVSDTIFEDILEPMTWATQGELILTSTPYGKSGYLYQQYTRAEHDDDWYRTQVSSYENPLIDTSDLERFKDGKTQTQIKREVDGEFDESGDSFFPPRIIQSCTANGSIDKSTTDCWLGIDIAGSGTDQTAFYGVDANGNVFLNNETYDDMGPLAAADYAQKLDTVHNFTEVFVDRSAIGEGTVEALSEKPQFERKVTDVYFTLQKKQQLYQRLKAALEDDFLVLPNDRELQTQLEAIEPSTTQHDSLRLQPAGNARDDHVDSLALACWGLPNFGSGSTTGPKRPVSSTNTDTTDDANNRPVITGDRSMQTKRQLRKRRRQQRLRRR